MPNYYNPYYPATYQSPIMGQASFSPYANVSLPQPIQQSYAAGPSCAMGWVDGEIEARGRQMPQGVTQYAMWDTNQQKIYLKSLNQMGMPNPMQIIRYTIEEQSQSSLPAGQSGEGNTSNAQSFDSSQFVTKQDFEELKNELRNMNRNGNQNGRADGSNSGQNNSNRGGNK